jgi:DNA-binding HxlR family transcriptional regulator
MMRSDCPVSYALDFFGDKWTFLVIRDLLEGKKFYKDFLGSKEGIATNILSDRLKKLEAHGIIESRVHEKLKTMKQYSLTQKGRDLIPIVIELMAWSAKYQTGLAIGEDFLEKVERNKAQLIRNVEARLDS